MICNPSGSHISYLSNRDYFGTKNMNGWVRSRLRESIACIRNLSAFSPESRKILVEYGFLDFVLRLIQGCRNEEILEQSLYCMGNLCVRNQEAVSFLLSKRITTVLIEFMWWKGNTKIPVATSFALRNLASNASLSPPIEPGKDPVEYERNTVFCRILITQHFKKITLGVKSKAKVKTLLGGLLYFLGNAKEKRANTEHADVAVKLITSIPLSAGELFKSAHETGKQGKHENLITGAVNDHIVDIAMPVLIDRLNDIMAEIKGEGQEIKALTRLQPSPVIGQGEEKVKKVHPYVQASPAIDICEVEKQLDEIDVIDIKAPASLSSTKLAQVLQKVKRKWLNMSNILASIGNLAGNLSSLKAEAMIDIGIIDHLLTILNEVSISLQIVVKHFAPTKPNSSRVLKNINLEAKQCLVEHCKP